MRDLAVIGGGIGGLALAALARARGLDAALFEAHARLGGCAGDFSRGDYTFDAGATALMGLGPGEPIGDLLRIVGAEFRGVETTAYRVHLPDRTLDITRDAARFEAAVAAAFPGRSQARRDFWRLQAAVGGRLFRAASEAPRLPVRSASDLAHAAKILGLGGLAAASTWAASTADVLAFFGLLDDRPFRSLIAMLLQDTAQAGPEAVPFANAAACLQAYRLGMSRPAGGMGALSDAIGGRFAAMGGDLRLSTIVDRVEAIDGGFAVTTRRRDRVEARRVAFNLPIDLAVGLLGRSLDGRIAGLERRSRAAWGAATGYLAIRRGAIDDGGPLFHQVLVDYDRPIHGGNNVLVSLSPPGDPGYGPPGVRLATMSTHTRPGEWAGLSKGDHAAKKAEYGARLMAAFDRALPGARAEIAHAEFATPRSFRRYTRRAGGAVGGAPVTRSNSNFLAVGPDALGPGLWLVGDSVFPGQGTMAVVLSAIRVVEKITRRSWTEMRADARPASGPEGIPDGCSTRWSSPPTPTTPS